MIAPAAGAVPPGRGLGWVDVHLLAGARLAAARLWTRDRALAAASQRPGVGFAP